jgi:FMN phosphatase YigB (HAD superfamily)
MPTAVDPTLVRDVDLLCLDAGNTVIFLDHARLARIAVAEGFDVSAEALVRCEGEAKRLQEDGGMEDFDWTHRAAPGGAGWGRMVGTILRRAGVPAAALPALVSKVWVEHVAFNLWSLVPDGFGAAMDRIRALGVRTAIVSNSEGMLDVLFDRLGVTEHIDVLVDSGKVGVEKPDPRIFQLALDGAHATKERALHLGDSFPTDVLGARAAGIRVALIDPYGQLAGRHLDVQRVPGVVAVADAIAALREGD